MDFKDHLKTIDLETAPLEDKLWRVQNLYCIRNKKGQLVRFELNEHQIKLVNSFQTSVQKSEPLVILKARQVGITTFFSIWFLDDALFYNGINAVIQSHKKESMEDIFNVVRRAYDYFPSELKSETSKHDIDRSTKIQIPEMNSQIEVKLESRSVSVNRIHYSEYAFIEEDRIAATDGALTPDCHKVIESTPFGYNHFYEMYKKHNTSERRNTFFIPWHEHSEYSLNGKLENITSEEEDIKRKYPDVTDEQLLFRRSKLLSMSHLQFRQEFPENDYDCFIASGNSFMDKNKLTKIMEEIRDVKPLEERTEAGLTIRVYQKLNPEELKQRAKGFYLGVDPAEGIGRDFSAAVLLIQDGHTLYQALTMHGQLSTSDFAKKIREYMYKNYSFDNKVPLAIIERNNHGHAVLDLLMHHPDYYYDNLYTFHRDGREGFITSAVSKKAIFNNLQNAINEDIIKIKDRAVVDELFTLELTDARKIEASKGKHDDLVMATALAFEGYYDDIGKVRIDFGDPVSEV